MYHRYEYSVTDGDVHSYKFTDYPVTLILAPAHYTLSGIEPSLNLYSIDLLRTGDKMNCNCGETVCKILVDFVNNNKKCSLGFYPSYKDNKEDARCCLFNKWLTKYVLDENITTIKNVLTFPTETGKTKEELTLQVFMHDEYEYGDLMLSNLNAISKTIASK
ncbi:MAG: hypothetical protein J0L87_12855 [Bacteroidetes bacterium]|nr:hypothetical protein [Bacteroidota bacterium]